MDEPEDSRGPATLGNVAIPDWMLKRRARLAAVANKNAQVNSDTPVRAESAPVTENMRQAVSSTDLNSTPQVAVEPAETDIAELAADLPKLPSPVPAKSSRVPQINRVPILVKAEQAPLPEWHETLRARWFGKDALGSYAISIGMHLVAALLLSLVVFHQDIQQGISTLIASNSEAQQGDIDDSEAFQVDMGGGQVGAELSTILKPSAVSSALGPSLLDTPLGVSGVAIGEGNGDGKNVGEGLNVGGFQMPEGGKGVVKKGSFTAWTVPADPAPGEDYKIIIQIQYKNPKQKIPTGDVTGLVTGTDRYRLMISPSTSKLIPEAHQVVVQIPGASERVRDTIRVHSAVLRESQQLQIVF